MNRKGLGARKLGGQTGRDHNNLGRNARQGPAGPRAVVESLDLRPTHGRFFASQVCVRDAGAGASLIATHAFSEPHCEPRSAHGLFIWAPGSQFGAWHKAAPLNVLDLFFPKWGHIFMANVYGIELSQLTKRRQGQLRLPVCVWVTGMRAIPPFCTARFPGSLRVLILLITQTTIMRACPTY
jgi:hypothetical protein